MWGQESLDLLQNRHILPSEEVTPPKPRLQAEQWNNANCSSEIFRSTLTKIPETEALLKKARLPLAARPPQPAVYLFLLDVSRAALETGYLRTFCDTLMDELDKLPGDGRTQVGFITYHRCEPLSPDQN